MTDDSETPDTGAGGATLIDGRAIAAELRAGLKVEVTTLRARGIVPHLAVAVLGDDPAARSYVRGIERAAQAVEAVCTVHRLPEDAAEEDLGTLLDALGADPTVHGIIVQTPLPAGLDITWAGMRVPVGKDVDGLNPISAGRLLLGLPSFAPATAAAVLEAVHRSGLTLRGAHAVVVGRSVVVGKPVALLLLREDATVTVCHSRTRDLPAVTRGADLLIAAVGRARMIGAGHVRPGAVVIDVGINEVDGAMVGDVDAGAVTPIAGAITPVPGGIGPLTNVMLLRNLLAAARDAV